jgi:hypothetical protein
MAANRPCAFQPRNIYTAASVSERGGLPTARENEAPRARVMRSTKRSLHNAHTRSHGE